MGWTRFSEKCVWLKKSSRTLTQNGLRDKTRTILRRNRKQSIITREDNCERKMYLQGTNLIACVWETFSGVIFPAVMLREQCPASHYFQRAALIEVFFKWYIYFLFNSVITLHLNFKFSTLSFKDRMNTSRVASHLITLLCYISLACMCQQGLKPTIGRNTCYSLLKWGHVIFTKLVIEGLNF